MSSADVAIAVESFVHAMEPARFFAQCRNLIGPGGVLVICDDFRLPTHDADATFRLFTILFRNLAVVSTLRSDWIWMLFRAVWLAAALNGAIRRSASAWIFK